MEFVLAWGAPVVGFLLPMFMIFAIQEKDKDKAAQFTMSACVCGAFLATAATWL